MYTSNGTVAVPVSVAAGAGTDASKLGRKMLTLEGALVGTYQAQLSADPAASNGSYINEGAPLTAAGALEITKPCLFVRWNCTAYTSGAPVSRLCGIESVAA